MELCVAAATHASASPHPGQNGPPLWVYAFADGGVAVDKRAPDDLDDLHTAPFGYLVSGRKVRPHVVCGVWSTVVLAPLADIAPPPPRADPVFFRWPAIRHLDDVCGQARKTSQGVLPAVTYRAKIKLHGTNAGVRVLSDGVAVAQGRNRCLTPDNDQDGFAAWVAERADLWAQLPVVAVFGEWCGRDIQAYDAITQAPDRHFAVFAVVEALPALAVNVELVVEPDRIAALLAPVLDSHTHVLPWHTAEADALTFCLDSPAVDVASVNAAVAAVVAQDPWVHSTLGVAGPGEGLVYYPVQPILRMHEFGRHAFKAKGAAHAVKKQAAPAQAVADAIDSAADLAQQYVTPARCQQAVAEAKAGEHAFVKWLLDDVRTESSEAYEWTREARQAIGKAARQWWAANA